MALPCPTRHAQGLAAPARAERSRLKALEQIHISLYPAQYAFVTDPRRFSCFVGGVGSGKTWAGAARALTAAAGHIDGAPLAVPSVGMVTAPTYNVLRDATIPTFRALAGGLVRTMTTRPPINALLANGSLVLFRSAHAPELLRGPSLHWWWGDEAALYPREVWRIMIGRLRAGGQAGYAWLTTTPKGRNWIYQEFIQQQRPAYAVFRAATRHNPFIDRAYFALLAESYSGDFARQELDGDFVAFEGLVYWEFDRALHVRPLPPDRRFTHVVAGVDWGYANPGVIAVFGVDADGRMWGLHEEWARQRRVEEWAAVARLLQLDFGIETFFCDPSEPAFIQQFIAAGCPALPADNDVLAGIQRVKNRLAVRGDGLPRLLFAPDFVQTAAEFEQYQWAASRDGLRDRPKKAADHCCDALRYAVAGVDAGLGFDAAGALYFDESQPLGDLGF